MKVLFWMSCGFDRRTTSEHLLVAIVQALYKNGHTVHIIQKDTLGSLPHLPKELLELGVTSDCIPCKLAKKSNFIGRYFLELRYIWKCKEYLRQNTDVGAVFNQSSTVAGFMAFAVKHIIPRARLTYNVQDIFPENAAYIGSVRGIVYRILSTEQRYAYQHADQIITISEDMKDLLLKKGADSKRTEVVYNWSYSDELYEYETSYSKKIAEFLHNDKFNVVYAGNIGIMQNVDVIIAAARRMKDKADICFHIFGDGVYKERFLQEAKELRNVLFWPMQPPELAPSIYTMADVNIIPLAPNIYRTALPSKTATCIACQKPIIFCIGRESKFGERMSKNEGLFVVNSANVEELSNAIVEIKTTHPRARTSSIYKESFLRSCNSQRYCDLIIGKR